MKAIMISIRPQWVAKILNGEKTIEIRKRFPSDYVGWVYIYCTKDGYLSENSLDPYSKYFAIRHKPRFTPNYMRGKVVARFWCDKVEEQPADRPIKGYVFELGCLTSYDILNYCGYKTFYAIHITKLEIFDRPKEISEFNTKLHIKGGCKNCPQYTGFSMPYCKTCDFLLPLTRAPQSYCYIEIE